MKTLDIAIGKKLPLDILMQPVALLAQRGWGKTVTAKAFYESAHDAGAQCITVFPTGKWWSLRLAADGKSAGLKDVFIIGGPHGDVPLTPNSGKLIAKLLVDKRIHAVIDVSLMRKGERHRFLADLFEEFWLLKKLENDNYPVVIFIEEAHAIAPQQLRPGQIDEARMLGAVEDLGAEGRNHDLSMSEMLKAGWMRQVGEQLELTDEGMAIVGATAPTPMTAAETQETWLRALPSYPATVLRALLAYPAGLDRPGIAEATGKSQTSSAFDLAISTLKKNHLVVDESGVLRPTEMLLGAA